jgi:prepilin-type N-terminal cleavage/methylation domain-containing protein
MLSIQRRRGGFTLVEILVVIGIIAILAALLTPATMQVVTKARNAAIALEIRQIADAIEAYKQDKGDYPPNFRDRDAFIRHIRRCYPKISPAAFNRLFDPMSTGGYQKNIWGSEYGLDEGEALVFWLSHTTTDPRDPFGFEALAPPRLETPDYRKYYDFDETRLVDEDDGWLLGVGIAPWPSFKAKYCRDSYYLYIDSRSYDELSRYSGEPRRPTEPLGDTFAFAEGGSVPEGHARPYWSTQLVANPPGTFLKQIREQQKPMNANTFQLLCAGQDGNFGLYDSTDSLPFDMMVYPTGLNYSDTRADRDNITNFSNGSRLADMIPAD